MRHFILLLLLSVSSLTLCAQFMEEDKRITNEFIVMLKPGRTVKDLMANHSGLTAKRCLSKSLNIWLMTKSKVPAPEEYLQSILNSEAVKLAQFNHLVQQRSLVPNDTFFSQLWNMRNTGQSGGTPGADIDAIDGWGVSHNNLTARGDTIVVAVVDVAFDHTHEDLNFFTNYHEIPDNDIDDDGNGFIDDYEGWNAYDTNGNVGRFGTDPHSMHVSGIVGAKGNNKLGVTGVCWGVQVMRVCGSDNDEATVVAAYDYVLTMRTIYNNTNGAKGAFVVSTNSSFGVDRGNPKDYPIWCAMYDFMGAQGILSAAATTNSVIDVDQEFDIPTTCPSKWLISVTNLDRNDRLGAGYGYDNIDLGAPGTSILSTFPNNAYGSRSGTSQATPHVAGAVAAMYAGACTKMIDDYYAFPDSIALIVKQMILDGTTHVSNLYNKTVTSGRLNLYHALLNLREYNCNDCKTSVTSSYTGVTCSNSCDGSLSIDISGSPTYQQQNLCPGYYPILLTDTSGCAHVINFDLFKPDSLAIIAIEGTSPTKDHPGNLIVTASGGSLGIQYSLDGINYQPTATFSIDSTGTYTVYVQNENNCVVQQQIQVTGIEKISAFNSLKLFPDPASDFLHVTFNTEENTPVHLSIINILGETIFNRTEQIPTGSFNTSIPVALFTDGIYILQLQTAAGTVSSRFSITK